MVHETVREIVYDAFYAACSNGVDLAYDTTIKDMGIDSLDIAEAVNYIEDNLNIEIPADDKAECFTPTATIASMSGYLLDLYKMKHGA